mgnify:CR=1 FL=1
MKRRSFIEKTTISSAAMFGIPSIVPATVFGKNAPSNRINIGQIGCGRIARSHDLPETMIYDVSNVMAVCDLDSNRMKDGKILVDDFYKEKKGKKRYNGTKMYEDYREMLLDKDIDAVMISTPDHWHAKMAIDAERAGKHVYVEKCMTRTITWMKAKERVETTGFRTQEIPRGIRHITRRHAYRVDSRPSPPFITATGVSSKCLNFTSH